MPITHPAKGLVRQHRLNRLHAVERGREAGVYGHLNDHLDDLFRRAADIERAVNMHRQLRLAVAERGKRRHGRQLPLREVEAGALVDVAERKFDHVARQVRRNGLQAVDDLAPGFAVNFLELGQAVCVAGRCRHGAFLLMD